MEIKDLVDITGVIFDVLGIFALVLGGLWAYTKYILERGLLPPVNFDVDCKKLGQIGNNVVIEVAVHCKNIGSSTLVARWIFLDIRYIKSGDKDLFCFRESHKAGRLEFKHSLIDDIEINRHLLLEELQRAASKQGKKRLSSPLHSRGVPILSYDTFVQPGVEQLYAFVTTLPTDAMCVLVYASFEYSQKLNGVQRSIYHLSRRLGLVHYSLEHVARPHTAERAFWIGG